MALVNAYLKLDGVSTGVPIDKTMGDEWMRVSSYAYSLDFRGDVSGQPGGFFDGPVTIRKAVDGATPQLVELWASGEELHKWLLDVRRLDSSTRTETTFFTVELTGARITDIRHEMLDTAADMRDEVLETIDFSCKKITLTSEVTGSTWESAELPHGR